MVNTLLKAVRFNYYEIFFLAKNWKECLRVIDGIGKTKPDHHCDVIEVFKIVETP